MKKDKIKHKTTLHPYSFGLSGLFAMMSMVSQTHHQKTSEISRLIAVLAFAVGVYNLYKERRLFKPLRPLRAWVDNFWQTPKRENESNHPVTAITCKP